ncbi:MAG: hypothetical protein KA311_04735 [Sediminibacterium sp.]|nr:hypothetical protein [Sediminibacterium sp.]
MQKKVNCLWCISGTSNSSRCFRPYLYRITQSILRS